jgi:hypothetical protein
VLGQADQRVADSRTPRLAFMLCNKLIRGFIIMVLAGRVRYQDFTEPGLGLGRFLEVALSCPDRPRSLEEHATSRLRLRPRKFQVYILMMRWDGLRWS